MENSINKYMPESRVKPRFDGQGSEFGLIHRELPKECGMFDIDRMSARAEIFLELKRQEIAFIEYRTDFNKCTVEFKALFEIKNRDTPKVREMLECHIGTATFAQLKLSRQIGARYFFVISTDGKQPFHFYEIENQGIYIDLGFLDYRDKKVDGIEAINKFWKKIGLL